MEKNKAEILKKNRTFKEESSLGKLQDRITELELRIEKLEDKK